MMLVDLLLALLAVPCLDHVVALFFQDDAQPVAEFLIVIDYQDGLFVRHRGNPSIENGVSYFYKRTSISPGGQGALSQVVPGPDTRSEQPREMSLGRRETCLTACRERSTLAYRPMYQDTDYVPSSAHPQACR